MRLCVWPVVLLRQRHESVARAESMVGLLMAHGELIQKLGEWEAQAAAQGFVGLRQASRNLQKSFEGIQMQFGEMQHEAWQAEHNLSTHLASLQELVERKIRQARTSLAQELQAASDTPANSHAKANGADHNAGEDHAPFLKLKAERLQSTVSALEQDLATKNKELVACKARLTKFEGENMVSELEQDLATKNKELVACKARLTELEGELSAKQAWATTLDKQLRTSKGELAKAQEELAKAQAICQESDVAIRELEHMQQKAVADMDQKQREEIDAVLQRLASLEGELGASRKEAREAIEAHAVMLQKCTEVEQENAAMKQSQTEIVEELNTSQQRCLEIVETVSKYKGLEDEYYSLQRESVERIQAMEKQMEDAEDASKASKAQLDELQQSHAGLILKAAESEASLQACKEKLSSVEKQREDMEEELKRVQQELAKHQEEDGNRANDLNASLHAMEQRMQAAEGGREEAVRKGHAAEKEIEALTLELQDCKQRLLQDVQEMDVMMIEVGNLQAAVSEQNSQYTLISEQLVSARARIEELEAPAARTAAAASSDPAADTLHDAVSRRRAAAWLNVSKLAPKSDELPPTMLASSTEERAAAEEPPKKAGFFSRLTK